MGASQSYDIKADISQEENAFLPVLGRPRAASTCSESMEKSAICHEYGFISHKHIYA